ncbi:hypothetical protein OSB04_032196 [Centaurea solstitialis]|uniref:Uncharacterized protein n=1 Tax=Centaurea solstitialis TaxID=347529 RepID=A0AA38SII4_9ASTR|nr:hypothetical protein OSB04_032196 [Centaurea solstitialis]
MRHPEDLEKVGCVIWVHYRLDLAYRVDLELDFAIVLVFYRVAAEKIREVENTTRAKASKWLRWGCAGYLAYAVADRTEERKLPVADVPVVSEFPDVFPEDLPGISPDRQVEFGIDLMPGAAPVARTLYRLAPPELLELAREGRESSGVLSDYRELNRVTIKNGYPLPEMDNLIDQFQEAAWLRELIFVRVGGSLGKRDLWRLNCGPDWSYLTLVFPALVVTTLGFKGQVRTVGIRRLGCRSARSREHRGGSAVYRADSEDQGECLADETTYIPLDDIQVDEGLNYVERPVAVLERKVKKLRNKEIGIVKGSFFGFPVIRRWWWRTPAVAGDAVVAFATEADGGRSLCRLGAAAAAGFFLAAIARGAAAVLVVVAAAHGAAAAVVVIHADDGRRWWWGWYRRRQPAGEVVVGQPRRRAAWLLLLLWVRRRDCWCAAVARRGVCVAAATCCR